MNQETERNNSMFRLRDMKNGLYQFHVANGPAFEGSKNAIKSAAIGLGIVSEEFDIAVFELENMGHDYAEFGIFGTFIYTMRDRRVA